MSASEPLQRHDDSDGAALRHDDGRGAEPSHPEVAGSVAADVAGAADSADSEDVADSADSAGAVAPVIAPAGTVDDPDVAAPTVDVDDDVARVAGADADGIGTVNVTDAKDSTAADADAPYAMDPMNADRLARAPREGEGHEDHTERLRNQFGPTMPMPDAGPQAVPDAASASAPGIMYGELPDDLAYVSPAERDQTLDLFGGRRNDFSSRYHLTRRGKLKRIRQIWRICSQFDVFHGLTPVKMRLMFEALGPTFVKVGQILSMRSEMLPQSFCDELAKLRADADPMPYDTVLTTLQTEYGRPVREIFAHIDPTPLGSASLAQVHRATLVTGEDVAVKVQRPGVREVMAQDVDIMRSAARYASRFVHAAQVVDLQGVVEELWETFEAETDFLVEARNLRDFKEFCKPYKYMDCPTPYMRLCTRHVVVMEYVDGISVSHPDRLIAAGYDLKEIGTKLVDNYATQILDDGFFHADPHPGNIMVRGGQIMLIDLGMTGRLNAKTRSVLQEMIFAVARQDSPALADGLLRFAGTDADPEDYPSLLAELDVIVKEFGTVDLKDLDIASFLNSLTQLASRHRIEVPSSVTTVGRALVTLEGLLDEFIPDVNMIEIISDHIAASKSKREFARDEARSLATEGARALHGMLATMGETKVAMRMLTRGQLRVNAELVGADEPMRMLSDMVNRIAMALIVVGLFVGSSIVYYAGIKPVVFGIPIVGFMGYVVAFVLSAWIVFDIYFKGRRSRRR